MAIVNLLSQINDDRFIRSASNAPSLSTLLRVPCSYIDEESPAALAPAILSLSDLAPGAIILLLAHHHPLPAPPQPR